MLFRSEAGSRLNINDKYGLVSTTSTGTSILNSTTYDIGITSKNLTATSGLVKTSNTTDWNNFPPNDVKKNNDTNKAAKSYKKLINQYDELMNDASYKGINLLKGNDLSVMFNEDRSSSLTVNGTNMTSSSLGLTTFEWQTQGDIAQSLSEIADALSSIRSFTTELGNNYSILTTRQNFTDSLINVLTEGADNLTLADMNSESATMLAQSGEVVLLNRAKCFCRGRVARVLPHHRSRSGPLTPRHLPLSHHRKR